MNTNRPITLDFFEAYLQCGKSFKVENSDSVNHIIYHRIGRPEAVVQVSYKDGMIDDFYIDKCSKISFRPKV